MTLHYLEVALFPGLLQGAQGRQGLLSATALPPPPRPPTNNDSSWLSAPTASFRGDVVARPATLPSGERPSFISYKFPTSDALQECTSFLSVSIPSRRAASIPILHLGIRHLPKFIPALLPTGLFPSSPGYGSDS
eukprot:gene31931-8930_t